MIKAVAAVAGAIALAAVAGCTTTKTVVVVGGVTATASAASSGSAVRASTGPFAVSMVSCGPLSAAQQTQFGTNAARGCVYKVTSHDSVAQYVDVTVIFMDRGTVVQQGYAGLSPKLAPGETWYGEADNALDSGGNGQAWSAAAIISYDVLDAPAGQTIGTYAPVRGTP